MSHSHASDPNAAQLLKWEPTAICTKVWGSVAPGAPFTDMYYFNPSMGK